MADSSAPPPLPEAIQEEVLRVFGSAGETARLSELAAEHPQWADAIAAFVEEMRTAQFGLQTIAADEPRLPDRIDRYDILEILGQGGMGTVMLAEQKEPVRRRVALKVIKLGMDSAAILRRFERERQALAVMNHETIARVFDAGTTDRGQPYFVMEYVQGVPITIYCDRNKLPVAERIRLFQRICEGVQHAHQKGVIHRDLKPTNVLVTDEQGSPLPKIIDFGLARATDHLIAGGSMFTVHGEVLGTPEYMSPEQADPTAADIDTRTDIYSLGVMLYELMVGSQPFGMSDLRGGLVEMQRVIREVDPPRPSTKLSSEGKDSSYAADVRRTTPAALQRALRSDLDWIVLKAMDKDRNRRYGSASELAQDLGRFLDHEPLVAGPPSATYRLRKLMRRYRGQVVAGALVFVSLLLGLIAFAVERAEANENARVAQENERRATQSARELTRTVDNFNMLANVVKLSDAIAEEATLSPAWPDQAQPMRRWLEGRAEPLLAALPKLRSTAKSLGAMTGDADATGRFLRDALAQLIADVETFQTTRVAGVRQRLAWAERVDTLSIGRHRQHWEKARRAIALADGNGASTRYRSDPPLDLRPQMGLAPLGKNPVTGLWEFYHLRSAADPEVLPKHAADGSIAMSEDQGIVFVLVPGGTFTMGSQPADPSGRNFDRFAEDDEVLVHPVPLAPFFLARHELTKAQWRRLSDGATPSSYEPGSLPAGRNEITWWNPVEQVDWAMCRDLLLPHRLVLPTEAQWEYACRAGTETPWSCGDSPRSLEGYANIADVAARGMNWNNDDLFDDGYVVHAPVGSFAANGFGFFDMHGNVFEWCRDWYGSYTAAPRAGDGLRDVAPSESSRRTARGGGFSVPATGVRSSDRRQLAPSFRSVTVGLRAARPLLR